MIQFYISLALQNIEGDDVKRVTADAKMAHSKFGHELFKGILVKRFIWQ